ncbi:hypothetical protein V6N11_080208 [Hibiscus sabdariffa]|uniref:Uncharacterized protein n=2 Tax=Hibiscus sabdariffa TaxID=183260 RepID=A0ABR1Z6Z7_9ROSI
MENENIAAEFVSSFSVPINFSSGVYVKIILFSFCYSTIRVQVSAQASLSTNPILKDSEGNAEALVVFSYNY